MSKLNNLDQVEQITLAKVFNKLLDNGISLDDAIELAHSLRKKFGLPE